MLGRDEAVSLLESALRHSPATQTEAGLNGRSSYVTRYCENYIHQNVSETGYEVTVRAVNGKRIGSASVNQLDESAVSGAVGQACRMASLAPETPDFVSLPSPSSAPETSGGFSRATAACPPDLRAAYVERVIAMAREKRVRVAGALSTDTRELAVANSLGVRAYTAQTRAALTCVAMSPDSSGYAEDNSFDVASIDPTRVAERAIEKCLLSRGPVTAPAGEYDVVMEPHAVASMLMYLAFLGLSAETYQEGRSFMTGALGQKVVGDNITIWDDGLDPAGLPMPFDFEGVPKRKVMLIENGVARGVVYNSLTAGREAKESTGHAVSMMGFTGSLPTNLFMAGGTSSVGEMIASTKRGILVSRFHYVNPVHPVKAVITGMTRDGTFLIEDGRIVRGLRNLRFTESVLGALSRVEALSAEREMGGFLPVMCPALKVKGFNFTGTTEF